MEPIQMEPIQIYDPVKNHHFEVYVSREVAERCRIDSSFAEDLYCQIREQNIEEGSTIEIQTEVVVEEPDKKLEILSKNTDTTVNEEEDSSKETPKLWSKDETAKLLKIYELLKNKLPSITPSSYFWNRISKELLKKNVQRLPNQCQQKWKNLKKSYQNALEKPDTSKFLFFYEIDRIVKGIAAPLSDDSEDIFEECDPEWEVEQTTEYKESWSRKETLTFLNIYLNHQESRKLYKTSMEFYTLLSDELAKYGINKAPEKCANKWKNLLRTYKRVSSKLVPHSVRFPYYSEVNKIMNSRKSDSDEEMIIDVSDADDSSNVVKTEEIIILADNGNKENLLQLPKDGSNNLEQTAVETENGDIKREWSNDSWTYEENFALIETFRKYGSEYRFDSGHNILWNQISAYLETVEIHRSPEDCKKQWDNLNEMYQAHKKLNLNNSRFPFVTNMDSIFGNDNDDELPENLDMNDTNDKCKCKERVLAHKRKRHQDRMLILKRKLNIEDRKVRAFEEYVNYLKKS